MVEEGHGGGRGWASIEPTPVVGLPTVRDEGPAQGERGCGGVLPFGPHSTMALFALVVQASSISIPLAELLPPSRPSGCLLVANRSPLPGSALQSPRSSTQPCLQWWTPLRWTPSQTGWAGQGSAPHLQLSRSCCHTWVAMFSSTENEALLLSKLSPRRGASPDVETAPHFHVPLRVQAPPHFLSSSFCFFFLLAYLAQQECICPSRFPRASATGQLGSVRSVPFLCILHVFVERDPLPS